MERTFEIMEQTIGIMVPSTNEPRRKPTAHQGGHGGQHLLAAACMIFAVLFGLLPQMQLEERRLMRLPPRQAPETETRDMQGSGNSTNSIRNRHHSSRSSRSSSSSSSSSSSRNQQQKQQQQQQLQQQPHCRARKNSPCSTRTRNYRT